MDRIKVRIRWMSYQSVSVIQTIDRVSFEQPWAKDEFLKCLRNHSTIICQVAEYNNQIIGFFICERRKSRYHILRMAVLPEFRRSGVGAKLTEMWAKKLVAGKRSSITITVRERDLTAQLFFKSLGYLAVGIHREYFDDPTEDAYFMQFRLSWPGEADIENRISGYFDRIAVSDAVSSDDSGTT